MIGNFEEFCADKARNMRGNIILTPNGWIHRATIRREENGFTIMPGMYTIQAGNIRLYTSGWNSGGTLCLYYADERNGEIRQYWADPDGDVVEVLPGLFEYAPYMIAVRIIWEIVKAEEEAARERWEWQEEQYRLAEEAMERIRSGNF